MHPAASDLQLVTGSHAAWALHNTAASRLAERDALLRQHQAGHLMGLAGLAVARLGLALAPHAPRTLIFAGPGNNGGDGLVAARHLHAAGRHVVLVLCGAPTALPADAQQAMDLALVAGLRIERLDPDRHRPNQGELVVDALLGIGSTRAPEGEIAAAIDTINAGCGCVLAVDMPSGLHADTGALWGLTAVRATATLSLLTLKPGAFTGAGRDHAGLVWLDRLGVDSPGAASAQLNAAAPAARARQHATHKGSFGDVAVVGGAQGMTGAALLASRAALAAGAGRVFCCLLDSDAPSLDLLQAELMLRQRLWLQTPAQLNRQTLVCGCGAGELSAEVLAPLLAHAGRLVLDADALNTIASDTALAQALRRRGNRGESTLITPHPLEAARLLGMTAAQVQGDRLKAAGQLAEQLACTVVLKGSGTVIAAPAQTPGINPTGNAALATAGTGDVLAGWIGGLWAAEPTRPAHRVAALVCWRHGDAADHFARLHPGAPHRASRLIEDMLALDKA